MGRRLRTKTRCGTLASVFSTRRDKEFHARIACLCVLFEDLRIELAGQTAQELGGLDECTKPGRKLYFLRRSIATLYEFAALIRELDQMPSFQIIRAKFDAVAERQWKRAVTYFQKYNRYVARLRNNVGGHFGSEAGESAIKNLLPDGVTVQVDDNTPRERRSSVPFPEGLLFFDRNISGGCSPVQQNGCGPQAPPALRRRTRQARLWYSDPRRFSESRYH